MIKEPFLYISHILEAIEHIEQFASGHTEKTLFKERMRYDAILRNLQTMAESSKRLPDSIKQTYPHVPWRDIAAFRNILVHDYLEGLDYPVLWKIISQELSILKAAMLKECPDWDKIKHSQKNNV
jgi:uncharacterized protein with HEPN domain